MKKVVLSLSLVAFVAMFAACSSPKSDGEKYAKKECECKNLKKEWNEDRENADKEKKYKDCKEELKAMDKQNEQKYENDDKAALEFLAGYASYDCKK